MNAQERVRVGRTAVTVSRLSPGNCAAWKPVRRSLDADAQAVVDAC
ncbi:MAG: hypothetical protein U0521_23875 [Anaerolineae bacterium]